MSGWSPLTMRRRRSCKCFEVGESPNAFKEPWNLGNQMQLNKQENSNEDRDRHPPDAQHCGPTTANLDAMNRVLPQSLRNHRSQPRHGASRLTISGCNIFCANPFLPFRPANGTWAFRVMVAGREAAGSAVAARFVAPAAPTALCTLACRLVPASHSSALGTNTLGRVNSAALVAVYIVTRHGNSPSSIRCGSDCHARHYQAEQDHGCHHQKGFHRMSSSRLLSTALKRNRRANDRRSYKFVQFKSVQECRSVKIC